MNSSIDNVICNIFRKKNVYSNIDYKKMTDIINLIQIIQIINVTHKENTTKIMRITNNFNTDIIADTNINNKTYNNNNDKQNEQNDYNIYNTYNTYIYNIYNTKYNEHEYKFNSNSNNNNNNCIQIKLNNKTDAEKFNELLNLFIGDDVSNNVDDEDDNLYQNTYNNLLLEYSK